jgi:uncharacterized protein (UPF0332 family)
VKQVAFADDLLEQADHLARREKKRPRQASLRRAVSTGYYALFHFLISEATLNWRRADQRGSLARYFEHGRMKAAADRQRAECDRQLSQHRVETPDCDIETLTNLRSIAHLFGEAQSKRALADYDNSTVWTRKETLALIRRVEEAFEDWGAIREEPIAQRFLVSMLGNPR